MTLFFLLVAVAIFATSLVGAVLAARSPILRRWVGVAIALLGAPCVTVDWNTAEFLTRVALIQVLGVGVSRSIEPGAHWHITVAFPLGAVIFLAGRNAMLICVALTSSRLSTLRRSPSKAIRWSGAVLTIMSGLANSRSRGHPVGLTYGQLLMVSYFTKRRRLVKT